MVQTYALVAEEVVDLNDAVLRICFVTTQEVCLCVCVVHTIQSRSDVTYQIYYFSLYHLARSPVSCLYSLLVSSSGNGDAGWTTDKVDTLSEHNVLYPRQHFINNALNVVRDSVSFRLILLGSNTTH